MKTVIGRKLSSARGAPAGFGTHVRRKNGFYANAYDLAKLKARIRDEEIAARLAAKEKTA